MNSFSRRIKRKNPNHSKVRNRPNPTAISESMARRISRYYAARYCVITIDAVRVSGIVTDETRLVSGG
jgi:hypothetical protein